MGFGAVVNGAFLRAAAWCLLQTPGQSAQFEVHVKGPDKQACSGRVAVQLGDKFVDVKDQGNGVHTVRFEVPAGQRRLPIKVKVNKTEIPGSPFVLNVDCLESSATRDPLTCPSVVLSDRHDSIARRTQIPHD